MFHYLKATTLENMAKFGIRARAVRRVHEPLDLLECAAPCNSSQQNRDCRKRPLTAAIDMRQVRNDTRSTNLKLTENLCRPSAKDNRLGRENERIDLLVRNREYFLWRISFDANRVGHGAMRPNG